MREDATVTGDAIPLCNSADLVDGGDAVPFDVRYCGQTCRGFAVRFRGRAHAYLNGAMPGSLAVGRCR